MGFDLKKFQEMNFQPRIEEVDVPDLGEFFDEGDKVSWKVRGLTGHEVAEAAEAVSRNKNLTGLIESLVGGSGKDKLDAAKEALGLTDKTPDDLVKRLAHLRLGSVDPAIDQTLSVRLATVYPIVFYQLTNKILELTGKGQQPGK